MRVCANRVVLLLGLFCLLGGTRTLSAQEETGPELTKFITDVDGSALFTAVRLDPTELVLRLGQQIRTTDLDCSHFVQFLFEQAGLSYGYAPSRILYEGMDGFRRVFRPEPGDLIVWPGHVGVVVDPDETTFVSALRSGVKTASYTSRYWKRRGRPRFFHYLGGRANPEGRQQASSSEHASRTASGAE
jgi:cell wall-associated NlpC family hydrolase